jgi:hypothetical protein
MCFFRPGAGGIELAIKDSQRVRGSALPKFSNSRFTRSVFAGLLVAGLAIVAVPAVAAQAAPLAGHSIATAGTLSLGKSTSGGGGAIDYWKITLIGGDQLQLQTSTPDNPCCEGNYDFNLYPPGTTDTNFPQKNPVANVFVDSGTLTTAITLQAPGSGTFILAICQDIGTDCRDVDSDRGANPMAPYTFTPTLVGGKESKTVLTLSQTTITRGNEKKLKLSVKVSAVFSGSPTGTVTISAGQKTVCKAKLTKGKGSCSPGSNTLLGAGTYSLVASFPGSKGMAASKSVTHTLTVKK